MKLLIEIPEKVSTITFTPSELVAFIGTIAGVCAGIATITGFIVALVKKWKAPEVEQNRRIKALEDENKEMRAEINLLKECRNTDKQNENEKFNEIDKSVKVLLRCMQALLAESLGDNDTEAIRDAKKDLDNYLLEK